MSTFWLILFNGNSQQGDEQKKMKTILILLLVIVDSIAFQPFVFPKLDNCLPETKCPELVLYKYAGALIEQCWLFLKARVICKCWLILAVLAWHRRIRTQLQQGKIDCARLKVLLFTPNDGYVVFVLELCHKTKRFVYQSCEYWCNHHNSLGSTAFALAKAFRIALHTGRLFLVCEKSTKIDASTVNLTSC